MPSTLWRARRRGERPVIYGRDRERAQLREILDDAIACHGSLVLISGEAGIGKTTLVDDLIHEARERDCLVLAGGCYDLTTTPPYGPWAEVIRDYEPPEDGAPFPSWFANPEALEQMGSQAQLFEEARRFFAEVANAQPLVIVLEDLHWSDAASLDALRYLSRHLANIPLLLVATYRDDEITRRHRLFQLLPVLVRESSAVRVHVNRLDEAGIREMIAGGYRLKEEDLDHLTTHIIQLAEGNPFYAVELLHTLADDGVIRSENGVTTVGPLDTVTVPPLIQQVIERRLSHFDDEQRKHLEAAAVIGHNVPLDIWLTVIGGDATDLAGLATAAISAHVLEQTSDGEGFRFTHALIRESLYSNLIVVARRSLHQRVGDALSEAPGPNPSIVADHFVQSGDDRAYQWLVLAAEQAERAWAWAQARDYIESAIGLLDDDHPRSDDRGWLLIRLSYLVRWMTPAQSVEFANAAVEEARARRDTVLEAYALDARGSAYCSATHFQRGTADIERSIGLLATIEEMPPAIAGPEILGGQAGEPRLINWRSIVGPFDTANEMNNPVLPLDDDYPDLSQMRIASALGDPEEALRQLHLYHRSNLSQLPLPALSFVASAAQFVVAPYFLDQPERRAQINAEYAEIMTPGSMIWFDVSEPAPERIVWGMFPFIDGDWESQHYYRYLTQEYGSWGADFWRLVICEVSYHQRQHHWIQTVLNLMFPDGSATAPGNSALPAALGVQRIVTLMALDTGDLDEAWHWIAAHRNWLEWSGAKIWWSEDHLLRAQYHRATGNHSDAREHAESAYRHASNPRQPLALIAADRFLGQLDVDEGKWDEAEARLAASLALAERCEAPFEQALTLVVMAEREAKLGEVDEARGLIKRVREICEPLGAKPTLERVDEIEAMLPRVRRGGEEHPFGLTGREVEVLRLVARGRTDAEAAEELFISPRTVSQHLRNIYNKLNVHNRAEATRVAVEEGIV